MIYWLSRSRKKLRINEFARTYKEYKSNKLKKKYKHLKRSLLIFEFTTKDLLEASFSSGKETM